MPPQPTRRRAKILYLVTEDWAFCSHRMPVARGARDAGAEVLVATRIGSDGPRIAAEGFRPIPLGWRRGADSVAGELRAIAEIAGVYRRERPDLVHHVAMKPIVIGGAAAALAGVPRVVNAAIGLGALFLSQGGHVQRLARLGLRFALNRRTGHLIVQNRDDWTLLREEGLLRHDRVSLIRGSGVDTTRFHPDDSATADPPIAAYVGRMLWDKGIGELVEAARLLRARQVPLRVVLVGPLDTENPAGIPEAQMRAWHDEGIVEWRGPSRDIPGLWREAAIAVLPSYREGLPKALLEAAACGRPMVAFDVPGSREIVLHEATGLLTPPRAPAPLADALARLAGDAALRQRLGVAARTLVEQELSETVVVRETLDLYRRLLPAGVLAPADGAMPAAAATGAGC
jgi:glycosyltransferase involved in cell wall biosynthesis